MACTADASDVTDADTTQPATDTASSACEGPGYVTLLCGNADSSAELNIFGYTGRFRCNTTVVAVDWDSNGCADEAFGIAPDRSIWHAWPNSARWIQMPNAGKADDMWHAYRNGNGQRQVEVCVFSQPNDDTNSKVWYSYYNGGWLGWFAFPNSGRCS
jgi:hypothetical protein